MMKKVIIKGMTTWDEEGNVIPCEDEWELGEPLSIEQLEALDLLSGIKTRSFSEMTKEEQKLFTDDDDIEKDSR